MEEEPRQQLWLHPLIRPFGAEEADTNLTLGNSLSLVGCFGEPK